MTDKHAQTTGATTASTEAGEQQTILSDCTALLWHHQRNVAQGRLQSEDVLLRAYVDGHCAVSEGLPPKRPETVAAAVVALFHGYLRQRRFLNATIAQLFGGDRWNVQARQRTLLGLLTHVLLFPRDTTLYDDQYKEDEEKRRDYVNAWTLATVRLLSKSKVSVRGAAAAAAENCIGGQAVAFLEQLFGGFIRTLPQPLPAKLEGRKGTSESIAGLMSAWIEVFEESFIAQRLVTPLTMIRGDLTRLVDALKVEVSGKLAEGSKAPTVPEPFNLRQPRGRIVEVPEPVRRIHKPRPIPSSHYDALPKINMQEEKDKVTHREQLEKVLKAAALNQFAVVQRTEDCMRRRRERVANAKQPPAAPAIIKAKPIPKTLFERDTAAVRLTAATILREEALIRKKQTEERLRLEQEIAVVAAGTISKRELDQKQQEIKILEEEEARLHSEKLKLLVELSKEEAIIAKEQSTKSKQEAANTVKSESHELRKKRERRMAQESDQKQRIVDGIQSTRDNVKEVKQRVLLENKERVAEIEREKEAMLMRKRQQDKEERERRSELIKQIRAMELVVAASAAERTTKHIDITTTSGCGILGEMSILELQERLSLLKIQEAKEESERRERIVDGKRQKQQELFEKMKRVERFRSMERAREEQRSKSRESTVASVLSQRAATADLYGPTTKLSPMVSGVVENVKEKTAAVQDLQARLATLKTQRLSAQLPGRSSSVQDERRKKAAANSPGNPVPSSAVREMESSILGLVDRLL